MSYLNLDDLSFEKRQEEADDRERDLAEGWAPPMTEQEKIEEKDLIDLQEYEANKIDPKN